MSSKFSLKKEVSPLPPPLIPPSLPCNQTIVGRLDFRLDGHIPDLYFYLISPTTEIIATSDPDGLGIRNRNIHFRFSDPWLFRLTPYQPGFTC